MEIRYFDLLLQILTTIISVYFFLKYKTKFMFFLALLLMLSVITESIGAYFIVKEKDSYIYYYIYSFLQFNTISLIYYDLIDKALWKKVIVVLSFVFSVFWIVVFFHSSLFFYLIILGAFNTSLYIFFYLRELLLSDKILNYKKMLSFWVSVGFLVFYLPSIPFFTLWKYMKGRDLFFILKTLIILMNLFIIYGLLCSKKEEKY